MVAEFYLATHKMQAQRVSQMWCKDFVADNLFVMAANSACTVQTAGSIQPPRVHSLHFDVGLFNDAFPALNVGLDLRHHLLGRAAHHAGSVSLEFA